MSKTCTSCGNPLNDIQKFCPKCGTKSDVAPPPPPPVVPNPYLPKPQAPASEVSYDQTTTLERERDTARTSERNTRAEADQLKGQLADANRNLQAKNDEITLLKQRLAKAEESNGRLNAEPERIAPSPQVQAEAPKPQAVPTAASPETVVAPKKKRKVWKVLLKVFIVLLVIILLLGAAFIFREDILTAMDNMGLQTYALRGFLRQFN